MDAKVIWHGGMTLVGQAHSPHTVQMDSGEASGGNDDGFRPTELVAIGTCGCSNFPTDFDVELSDLDSLVVEDTFVRGDLEAIRQ